MALSLTNSGTSIARQYINREKKYATDSKVDQYIGPSLRGRQKELSAIARNIESSDSSIRTSANADKAIDYLEARQAYKRQLQNIGIRSPSGTSDEEVDSPLSKEQEASESEPIDHSTSLSSTADSSDYVATQKEAEITTSGDTASQANLEVTE